jgi:hypothetical protein
VSRYEDIAERLRGIAEELDDASFELLHDAVASGETTRPKADKTLTQARRAIEKAATLLDTLASASASNPEVD